MNAGTTLFAQSMDFLSCSTLGPCSTFGAIVARYDGDRRVRTWPCASHFRVMAFADRPAGRACATCLAAHAGRLYQMGFRQRVHRSRLADANGLRDWRIRAKFAQRRTARARRLHAGDDPGGSSIPALLR